jgi:hypothetical protein
MFVELLYTTMYPTGSPFRVSVCSRGFAFPPLPLWPMNFYSGFFAFAPKNFVLFPGFRVSRGGAPFPFLQNPGKNSANSTNCGF